MTTLTQFLDRCDRLAHYSGLSLVTVSCKILGGSTRLTDLRTTSDIGVKRLERAVTVLEGLERQYNVPLPDSDAGTEPATESCTSSICADPSRPDGKLTPPADAIEHAPAGGVLSSRQSDATESMGKAFASAKA